MRKFWMCGEKEILEYKYGTWSGNPSSERSGFVKAGN